MLAPYGVTNEELDPVANYYRFSLRLGQTWPHTAASAVANVTNGRVTGFTITSPGVGYSYAPTVVVPGFPNVQATAIVAFTTDFKTNGSISAITLTS